jgi:hypothetical protein
MKLFEGKKTLRVSEAAKKLYQTTAGVVQQPRLCFILKF